MTEERYGYSYTDEDAHGNKVTHTRHTVGFDNVDTILARGINRYGWRDVDYWREDSLGRRIEPSESDPESYDPNNDPTLEGITIIIHQRGGIVESVESSEADVIWSVVHHDDDDGPYCYCGHTEESHTDTGWNGPARFRCIGCEDVQGRYEDEETADPFHRYERAE